MVLLASSAVCLGWKRGLEGSWHAGSFQWFWVECKRLAFGRVASEIEGLR